MKIKINLNKSVYNNMRKNRIQNKMLFIVLDKIIKLISIRVKKLRIIFSQAKVI